jgi:acyl-coenzyme A synthetase/AMP-(fatty) acid ligase
VTDRQLGPTPGGIPGEVLIGGEGVVRGYWNRPDLTAARFVPYHLGARPGGRLYRTGDLARYLPDGNLEFLGRLDDQVKIRGHRVELTEIEETLRQYPGVYEAAVVVRKDSLGGPRLVAYWTPVQESISKAERADQQAADSYSTGAGENRYWCTLPGAMTIAHHGGPQTRVMVREVFEQQVYLQNGISLCEKACIFDVGANIGLFTL